MEKSSKKKKVIIISCIIVLIAILILLWWFFFRKIKVTLDYNNDMKDETILVQINKTINKDKINDKNLGEKFIGWFKVIGIKDKKEILDEKEFDFNTKINKKIKLNAVYKEDKNITVKFDSMGGTKVNDLILKEGEELKLPNNPTKNGYEFITWKDKNEIPIGNGALLADDIVLYAYWEKVNKNITVKFDSMGGTKVNDLILKEGEELKLPNNPTRNGYEFITWKDKNEIPIGNGALLADDIILYAYWEEIPKP